MGTLTLEQRGISIVKARLQDQLTGLYRYVNSSIPGHPVQQIAFGEIKALQAALKAVEELNDSSTIAH